MSNTKNTDVVTENTVQDTVKEDIRLDKKVKVCSIAPWITGAPRKTTMGDISIPSLGSVLLTREEIISQAQNGNKLLNGIDGVGSHATWYVEDYFVRQELGYEDNSGKNQMVLTREEIERIFNLKTPKSFEYNIVNRVVTRAERAFLMNTITALGLNDFKKIDFCIKHTGMQPKS